MWILQARILEWVAVPSSRGSSQPRDQTQVSCIAGRPFTAGASREACLSYLFFNFFLPVKIWPFLKHLVLTATSFTFFLFHVGQSHGFLSSLTWVCFTCVLSCPRFSYVLMSCIFNCLLMCYHLDNAPYLKLIVLQTELIFSSPNWPTFYGSCMFSWFWLDQCSGFTSSWLITVGPCSIWRFFFPLLSHMIPCSLWS